MKLNPLKFCFLLFYCLFSVFTATAQQEYTSSVPRAVKQFDAALQFYDARKNKQALEAVDQALEADPKFIEAYMLRANIYSDMKNHEQAILAYNEAIRLNPDFFPNNYFSLAKSEYLSGHYGDAKIHYQKFLTYPKIKANLAANAKQMVENCAFAEQAVKNPVPFNPINMGDSINTDEEEYFPAITADAKTFLFTRRIRMKYTSGRTSQQEDFFVSHYENGHWTQATPVTEINTSGNEGAPSLSADGQYLFFTACQEMFEESDARKTNGSCDIFIAKKVGDKYTAPRNLEIPINTGAWESQPSFSSDGRSLYFVRAIKGSDGRTQRDIMVSRIGDNSAWSEPVSVSDKINTTGDEMSVFIHPDDQTLYFSSDGHPGMGGLDIFMSKKTPLGEWGEPVNLGYPINTPADENSLLVSPNGELAFFASDRPGGKGQLDLYQFALPEAMRPQPVTYMKGKVFDIETKKVLSANFELIDLASGKTVVSSSSNVGNGEFLVCLPTGKKYALNVSKDGYLFYSENFQLQDSKSSKDPVLKDVGMKPIKVGQSVVLKNIFYDFDKYDLKDESMAELGKLILFLTKNPKIRIEVGGHTDNVGGKQYNQQLSEKRAKSVFDYLIQKNIPATRLEFKGYGDSKPVADNSSEQGRSQNRRTEFTILSVD